MSYSIFVFPASVTLADRLAIAWIKAKGISDFEGASGVAWFWMMFPCAVLTYALCIAVLAFLLKRPRALIATTLVLAVLSVPSLAFVLTLFDGPEIPLPSNLRFGSI
ncbi:hypothetical protein [Ralstonia sp. 1138]|uniref:hypothetical protein n=1 Tax=Ralstonia sp. 1138 TaxID=3156423 RepID=UPI00339855A8